MALRKHQIRELAMQTLFVWDANGARNDEMAAQVVRDGTDSDSVRRDAVALAGGAWENRQIADQWVERLAAHWPTHRQPGVDRNILRLAIWELTSTTTPPKVVLDEAIELAKSFSTEQSASFVNGVLDAVLKERQQLTQM